jgi:hypothetical protein
MKFLYDLDELEVRATPTHVTVLAFGSRKADSTTSRLTWRQEPRANLDAQARTPAARATNRFPGTGKGDETRRLDPLDLGWMQVMVHNRRLSWVGRFAAELRRFSTLPKAWDSYVADPPNEVAIRAAERVLDLLWDSGYSKPSRIAPSSDDGVLISFMGKKGSANIECFNSGEIVAAVTSPHEAPRVWQVDRTPGAIRAALEEIADAIKARSPVANVSRRQGG